MSLNELPFNLIDDTELHTLLKDKVISFDLDSMIFDPLRGQQRDLSVNDDEDDIDIFLSNQCSISIPESNYIQESFDIATNNELFNLMFLNIRSIPNNINLFKASYSNCADVLGLAETRLLPDITHLYEGTLPGYTLFSQPRDRHGGGVSMYVKHEYNASRITQLDITESYIECIACTLAVGQATWVVLVIYRPPDGNVSMFLDSVEEIFRYTRENNYNNILITGDLNIDLLKNDNKSEHLINLMSSNHCFCTVTKPTRVADNSATLIDHVWASIADKNLANFIIQDDISDHYLIFSQFKCKNNKGYSSNGSYKLRILDDGSKENFLRMIQAVTWDDVMSTEEVDPAYELFFNKLMQCYDQCFLFKDIKCKPQKRCPWMTPAIKDSLREKRRLHRLAKKWPLTYKEQYLNHRDHCNQLIKNASNEFYLNELESNRGNIKQTWKTINTILGRSNQNANCIKCPRDDISVENYINQYFIESIDEIKSKLPQTADDAFMQYMGEPQPFSMRAREATAAEIINIVKSIRTKAIGMDGFSPIILKLCINSIIAPLVYIVNLSLKKGVFPHKLKVAKVIPIHKTGDTSNVANKRPVSILNCLSKVFEKVIFKRIAEYLEEYNVINDSQHGFRKNRSTETAIGDFLKTVYKDINSNKIGLGIFIDYSKAFDCIDFDIFVKKLEHIGIRGSMKKLLANYLRGRTQCVFYDNRYSDPIELRQGAPQGSNLAPLIWQIYGNDMVNCSNSLTFSLFADDTNGYDSHTNIITLIHMVNNELAKLYKWIVDNRLSMNVKK